MSKKILVVDDDPDICEQLSLLLKQDGYDVTVAGGQEEAEQALLAGKPDLAILDLMMEHPDSGFVLCHEIKRLFPGTPVIVLTSVQAATAIPLEAASREQQSGVKPDRVGNKPLRPEQLCREVQRLLTAG